MRTGSRTATSQGGFTYFGVLFIVVIMGLMLASVGEIWATAGQRARERELLWVGTQYAQALRSYYSSSPGVAQYPAKLEDLLNDNRFPEPKHHLRRLYPDPMLGNSDWGLVKSIDGRITGVYSQSTQKPLKQSGFPPRWTDFAGMESYADWQFVAEKDFADARQSDSGGSGQPATANPGQPQSFQPSPAQTLQLNKSMQ